MLLNDYQNMALSTAVYPKEHRVFYPALGLAGEAGEVANKVKKILRDAGGVITKELREAILKEMGDTLWYLATLSADLGYSLNDVALDNLSKLKDRQERDMLGGSGDER